VKQGKNLYEQKKIREDLEMLRNEEEFENLCSLTAMSLSVIGEIEDDLDDHVEKEIKRACEWALNEIDSFKKRSIKNGQ
jgi:hypothetical protein